MPAADRVAHSDRISAALINQILPHFSGRLIGFYWPFKGEYDPRSLARSLPSKGARLALPVVLEKPRPLIFREWWPGIRMTKGIWNIPIPEHGSKVVPDILLIPLVGFDQRKYRLGYGGGYYDRTLAVLPIAIGRHRFRAVANRDNLSSTARYRDGPDRNGMSNYVGRQPLEHSLPVRH
jgi:5-formyltetrahydrofolate cyclo-ligase